MSNRIARKLAQPFFFNLESSFSIGRELWTERAEELAVASGFITVAVPVVNVAAPIVTIVSTAKAIAIIIDQDFLQKMAKRRRVYKMEQ